MKISKQLTRWAADPENHRALRKILDNPTFVEAVGVITSLKDTSVPNGPNAITDFALYAARSAGMQAMIESLEALANPLVGQQEQPNRPAPWSHFTVEKSQTT